MKSLGKKIAFVAFLVGSLSIPLTAFAQTSVPQVAYSNFDAFLTRHPKDAQELSNNPALANSPNWLEHHPQAKDFFNNHTNVRHGMRTNASQFMATTQSWHNQSGNYANPFTGNSPQQGPGYQQGWTNGYGNSAHNNDHDWDHNNEGSHGHHYAYGHDKQDNWKHGRHWAEAQDNWHHGHHDNQGHGHHDSWGHGQDNWDHGHHGPWEHGHGGHDQGND